MTVVYAAKIVCQNRRDRAAYSAAARRLLKEAVKREYQIDISSYTEKKSESGKPYFEGAPFCFNLSHGGEYVVCALSDCEVGVDIEAVRPISDGVMRRFVGKVGNDDLANTRLWTRYEAIGKFLGTGIPYNKPTSAYFVKEYFDLDSYALSVCAEEDGFFESVTVWDI